MALNPLVFTENVLRDFLKYQLSAYPLADSNLYQQLRSALSLDETRNSPLLKGPFVSLSRSFKAGAKVEDLVAEKIFHPFMKNVVPYPSVFGHQEKAIRAAAKRKTVLVSTGTGSGKTETFLYPIISKCLELRDQKAPAGITAVIVYPMNALAEDQLIRLRGLLAGTGITFGMYVGKTPRGASEVNGYRMPAGSSKAAYDRKVEELKKSNQNVAVIPSEERASREEMKSVGGAPRILLTNVKQLELLLTRSEDIEMFDGNQLEFIVFDEAHTFSGAMGSETALLIRRLRAFCGKSDQEVCCIATSATIADKDGGDSSAFNFATRFFGVESSNIELVREVYEPEIWAKQREWPTAPIGIDAQFVSELLEVLDQDDDQKLRTLLSRLGINLASGDWRIILYELLLKSELAFQINDCLAVAKNVFELPEYLSKLAKRLITAEEIVCYLALGAAAQKDGRSLLRPVVHVFLRGVGGAVVTFEGDPKRARLWLAASIASSHYDEANPHAKFQLSACTRCGQHYYSHHYADVDFSSGALGGGHRSGNGPVFWEPLGEGQDGIKTYFIDRLIGEGDDDDGASGSTTPPTTPNAQLQDITVCEYCGTLHSSEFEMCGGCGRPGGSTRLRLVIGDANRPSSLRRCLACGKTGSDRNGQFREPARPVRATHVSDVHVIAQSMLQHAERPRLLIFTDSRQDAAFQAGWMKDHARRFRLRALMNSRLRASSCSVALVVDFLCQELDRSDDLSRALIPEVWREIRKDADPRNHAVQRKQFLRYFVLREITTNQKERLGLEPWGRLDVEYLGISSDDEIFQRWSASTGIVSDHLFQGILSVLDYFRRNKLCVFDREYDTFSRIYGDGDSEVQRGYMPRIPAVPFGINIQGGAQGSRVGAFYSNQGYARQKSNLWGIPANQAQTFWTEIWEHLLDKLLIVPTQIFADVARGRQIRGSNGIAHQIDADKLLLKAISGLYVCGKCGTKTQRMTPSSFCVAWRCDGVVERQEENQDSYDLALLDGNYRLMRPQEHSAQVPHEEREKIERDFKDSISEKVNTLVCTPTLEMGIDIGGLDSVLMRNVPPAASNYWQRAGRAGRRARMAVNMTYSRNVSHDISYFEDPARILSGKIDTPQVNLRNELMVQKHIRSAILSQLYLLVGRSSNLDEAEKVTIRETLERAFPKFINKYIFENGNGVLLQDKYPLNDLRQLLDSKSALINERVWRIFENGWPKAAAVQVNQAIVDRIRSEFTGDLSLAIDRLRGRAKWLIDQISRLATLQQQAGGTLAQEESRLRTRCERLLGRMKAIHTGSRTYDSFEDMITFNVLASEGFLPGYGLEIGSIVGFAEVNQYLPGTRDFALPRPSAVALREYVPGNAIYANGHRFAPRIFQFKHDRYDNLDLFVDVERELARLTNSESGGSSAGMITGYHIADTIMPLSSSISDEEEFRFRLPTVIVGANESQHGGGTSFQWGDIGIDLLKGLHLKLVNVGPTRLVADGDLGYRICTVCHQSVSPFASQAEDQRFIDHHLRFCGKEPRPIALYANIVADTLMFKNLENRTIAYTLLESIRTAACEVLQLEEDDFEILVIGRLGEDRVDAYLYDPMQGGSGNLEETIARWNEIIQVTEQILSNCRSACDNACADCLLTFWNQHYHKYLNRISVLDFLRTLDAGLSTTNAIPPVTNAEGTEIDAETTNMWEATLRRFFRNANFPTPEGQKEISLGRVGKTYPDFYFSIPSGGAFQGICVYYDGHHHDRPDVHKGDQIRREELRNQDYVVVEIRPSDLGDSRSMAEKMREIARHLLGREQARRVLDGQSWFSNEESIAEVAKQELNIIPFVHGERPIGAVPYFDSLNIAAGAFGQESDGSEPNGFILIEKKGDLTQYFAAKITGTSMEPLIPNGSICLFKRYQGGSRQNQIVLVERRDLWSIDDAGDFVIKKYVRRTEVADAQDRSGIVIELESINSDYPPIVLKGITDDQISTPAIFVEVL